MRKEHDGYIMYDVGDEIHPGFHVGDKVKMGQRGAEIWVSNVKSWIGANDGVLFAYTLDDPNAYKLLRTKKLLDGYIYSHSEVELVECMHPEPPSDEEIAALFGVGLDALPKKRASRKRKVAT